MRMCRICGINPVPAYAEKQKDYRCGSCAYLQRDREKLKLNGKQRRDYFRSLVLDHYGRECAYCHTTDAEFHIDHKYGDGNEHRKTITSGGNAMARLVVKEDYPDRYQILCRQCNMAKQGMSDKEFRTWIATMAVKLAEKPVDER